jgi:hypothetical protein
MSGKLPQSRILPLNAVAIRIVLAKVFRSRNLRFDFERRSLELGTIPLDPLLGDSPRNRRRLLRGRLRTEKRNGKCHGVR